MVVGTPCHGGLVTSAYFSSVLKLQEACLEKGMALTFLMPGGDDLVERARQEIAASFMAIPGATHLLFIDADIGFEPEQVFRLIRFDAEVAAAVYPLKRFDWERAKAAVLAGREKMEAAALCYALELENPVQVRDGFIKVRSTGTGFLMIQRKVFTAMMGRYPELRYSNGDEKAEPGRDLPRYALFNCLIDGPTGLYLSEDYSFCRRWTGMGGEIWVDQQSRLNHLGQASFAGEMTPKSFPNPEPGGSA